MSAPVERANPRNYLTAEIWRMADGSWGASTERNGVGVAVRGVSFLRALWHVLTVRRPDEWGSLVVGPEETRDHA